jgi:dihydrodipicolinate synthase/N-acetylneuraminate lyase
MPSQRAVITAVTTPFTPDGDIDLPAARRLYRFAAETTGQLLVAGTTGEFPALSTGERLMLIETALEAAGPQGVVAHIGAADAHSAQRLTKAAVAAGCRRLAALTPYYLPATGIELHDYFSRIREAAADAQLYGYLFPERSGLVVDPEQYAELISRCGLAGVKLSGAASQRVGDFVAAAPPGFEVYSGNDRDLAAVLAAGGTGTVSGCAAALPEPFLELADAAQQGRTHTPETQAVQDKVDRIVDLLGPSIGRIKCAQHQRGLPAGHSRMTVADPEPEVESMIKALAAE